MSNFRGILQNHLTRLADWDLYFGPPYFNRNKIRQLKQIIATTFFLNSEIDSNIFI